tara:strand:- start:134 stop:460 length:327 start_codon:yes stop_codon:yes gene_type:complete
MKKIFLIISLISPFFITANAEQWDKNITTKVDVESFWNQVKETREIKYGKDSSWDKNMNYCSYFAEKIAVSKGEGYVMSNLIKYADKCHKTLNFMTRYMLDETAQYEE